MTIKDDHPVSKLDENINVQTGFRKVIEGMDLVFEQITEIAEVSGINVVSGRYHMLTSVKNKNVSLKITEFSDSSFKITGETTDLALVVLVALRPFLL
ncbi:MAG: hypothetical protein PHD82_07000 [Candidatus Riflebacteria bacterium]|nr:hypothetical protein [Candidatus Riflebacteria bacterium]